RVRYIGIDAPEHDQPCGPAATEANADLLEAGAVTMVRDVNNTDRYGRLLRYVYIDDVFVNEALVQLGYAIARRYPPDTAQAEFLEAAEVDARSEQAGCHALGIFGDTGQAEQSTRQPVSTPAVQRFGTGGEYTCDCSRACRNLTCDEAYYQLNVCGCTERDGDGDGKPCESQCGG
ncbi:MAG: thermonuclease family protein, partial [Anaerolineae bacterium]|nr:thermonuclease family protein [Anaerolineae bacterium]